MFVLLLAQTDILIEMDYFRNHWYANILVYVLRKVEFYTFKAIFVSFLFFFYKTLWKTPLFTNS